MIIGAGIYVLIGKVSGIAGYGVWLSFLIASFLAVFTGLSYAELSSNFNDNSAEYIYVKKSIGSEFVAEVVSWLIILSSILSGSVVALGLAGYLGSIIGLKNILMIAILTILVFSYINYKGLKLSSKINDVATLLEISGLVAIIVGAIYVLIKGNFNLPSIASFNINKVVIGSILSFFAYIGFGSIVKITEEVKEPQKNIPRAIILSIGITTILYVLVAFAAVILVSPSKLYLSHAPASLIASYISPHLANVIGLIAIISTSNTLLLILISTSRQIYGLAKHNVFPRLFSHVYGSSPIYSIILVSLLTVLFVFYKDIVLIADITNIWIFVVYFFVNLSVVVLRFKSNTSKFKSPGNIGKLPIFAIFGMITSLMLIVYYMYYYHISLTHPLIYLTAIVILLAYVHVYIRRNLFNSSNKLTHI